MNNPYIDLKKCKQGDLLLSKDGSLAEYVEYRENEYFPHSILFFVEYNGRRPMGTRNDDGSTFKNKKLETDLDVVIVFPKEMNTKQFRNKLLKNLNSSRDDY